MTIISSFSKDVSIFLNTDRMPMSISYRILNGEARSGVVSAMAQWDAAETRGWLVLQFTGLASLFLARCFLVVSIVPMSQELGWDSRQCVSRTQQLSIISSSSSSSCSGHSIISVLLGLHADTDSGRLSE